MGGQTLALLCQRGLERDERLAPEFVAWIGARAARALGDVHAAPAGGDGARAIHGRVTPENVLLAHDGSVVLAGASGAKGDPRDDLFALAATLYEAAVGTSPLPGALLGPASAGFVPPPSSVLPGFPEELSGILLRALERDPAARPATAGELARDLDHFAGQNASASSLSELLSVYFEDVEDEVSRAPEAPLPGPTTAGPTSASVRPATHEKPSRWGLVLLGCALVMAVASLFATTRSPKEGDGASAAGPVPPRPSASADPAVTVGNNAVPVAPADAGRARFVP